MLTPSLARSLTHLGDAAQHGLELLALALLLHLEARDAVCLQAAAKLHEPELRVDLSHT